MSRASLIMMASLCGVLVLTGCCASPVPSAAPQDPIDEGFALIRAGEMIGLGSAEPAGSPLYHHTEQRVVIARIDEFLMARVPVTVAEFCAFLETDYAKRFDRWYLCPVDGSQAFSWSGIDLVGDRFCPKRGAEQQAADAVTWHGAVEYCRWLTATKGAERGVVFRLPNEVEWEYAARGSEGRLWPWGNAPPDASRGWAWRREGRASERWRYADVGSFPAGATPEGIMDMMGTPVREWCSDRYVNWPPAGQTVAKVTDTSTGAALEDGEPQWGPRHVLLELWELAWKWGVRLLPGRPELSVRVARGGLNQTVRVENVLHVAWRLVHGSDFHAARVWTRVAMPSFGHVGGAVGFRLVAERSRVESQQ